MVVAVIRILIILLFLPIISLGQLNQLEVRSEIDLAQALYRANSDLQSRESLLGANQPLVNDRLWTYLNGLARTAYFTRLPQQSLNTYETAIVVAGRLQDKKLLAISYYNIGIAYSGLNQYSNAISSYEKSREQFEQAGLTRDLIYVLADLGALYFIVEDYNKAKDCSYQVLELADKAKASTVPSGAWPDDVGRARALTTLAEIDSRDGDYTHAIERFQESLALHQKLNLGGPYLANDLASLGRVYTTAGDYANGLSYLNKALELAKILREPNTLASLLNSIGFLYLEQEDYPQAKQQFDQSLEIYRREGNQREVTRVLLNLGVTAQRKGDYDDALKHFQNSAQAAKATQLIDGQIAAGEGIGVVLTAKKDFTGALEVLNQSLALAKDMKDKTRQAEIIWRTSQTYYGMANYKVSAVLAENALELSRAVHSPKLVYLATTTLGESYAAQKKTDLATKTLKQAVEQLERMRAQIAGNEVESQLFLENKIVAYHGLVDLFIQQDKPLDALLFAERAKGRVLLDVLSSGKSDLVNVLTPAEKAETQRLNREISVINDRVKAGNTADASSLETLYSRLDSARLEYQSFQDALYIAHPDLRVRTGQTMALTTTDLDRLTLDKDSGYLEYVVTKEQIYLFVVTRKQAGEGFELKAYPVRLRPDELARKVNLFHQRLADRHPDFAGVARELYGTLIEPAAQQLRGIRNICIVPDGFLWNLPFQAIMTETNHYLIEDYSLYYAPSLTVLREMTKDRVEGKKQDASLIAFGNPVIGKDDQRKEELCPLPEAETEVSSIAKTFIAKTFGPSGNKVLIGREASEKSFKALAWNYATIHLATHGVIDNRQPLYSHLLLTKTEADSENDGLLEAREIMNMKLNADLAVLSACETANGRISPGEGVMGTTWAFFVAGARSMLVSQWKVNSASTTQLMANFYSALQSGPSTQGKKAQSLQEATTRLMKDDRYRHPFYWAGFVLVGNNN
ncbi:MAG: CHAT domain-containing tetratricopeptide repeat protein [Pyrinomonadaceae bacterium]